jgi:hypothetical protein
MQPVRVAPQDVTPGADPQFNRAAPKAPELHGPGNVIPVRPLHDSSMTARVLRAGKASAGSKLLMQHILRAGGHHLAGRGNTLRTRLRMDLSRETADFDSLRMTAYAWFITA